MKTKGKTTTTKTKTKTKNYIKISTGVYQRSNGTYRVRKMVNGVKYSKEFTNKTTAIKYYKSLC